MTQQHRKAKPSWVLTPIFGTLLFTVLYVVATFLYPGGSQADQSAAGFSWTHNYWCNLLNENAINGQSNPAKPVALTALFVLCFTLAWFWFQFPRCIKTGKWMKATIQISGILAMVTALLLFTTIDHDFITNLASFFGLVATAGTITVLYKTSWTRLFVFGLFNILLVALNNYVYHNKALITCLPIIQKISFASFLTWICCIDFYLFRKLPIPPDEIP